MEYILEAENLTKVFKTQNKSYFTAVDSVSFKLEKGESLGIVGESGSGKSTIARMLLRLTDVSDGKIYLYGEDITNFSGKNLRKVYGAIQMIFQSAEGSFNPRKTLGYSICESLRNLGMAGGEAKKRAEYLLEECGLSGEFLKKYPHEVSGGQCQRAAIARALAAQPKILVCDEATSALDVTVQKQIMELLTDLKNKNNLSYIFICHNLALVQSFCDRVLVMSEGIIVEEGTPDEVIFSPKSSYTKILADAAIESSL